MQYSKEILDLMEDCYRKHGASSNAAQLTLRRTYLQEMVDKLGEDAVKTLLCDNFPLYHRTVLLICDGKAELPVKNETNIFI